MVRRFRLPADHRQPWAACGAVPILPVGAGTLYSDPADCNQRLPLLAPPLDPSAARLPSGIGAALSFYRQLRSQLLPAAILRFKRP